MNAAYFTLFAVVIASTVASCKKDDEEAMPGAPVDPNAAYSTSDFNTYDDGNYWVYERITYDSNSVLVSAPVLDSFFVAGDTVLFGNTWKIVRRGVSGGTTAYVWHYVRDSADCIVAEYGKILFRYGVFDQVAWTDTVPLSFYLDHTISSTTSQQVVPAGTFTSYTDIGAVGEINLSLPVPPSRYPYYCWSPGVGKVKEMEPYVSSGWMQVRSLLRYHVQ